LQDRELGRHLASGDDRDQRPFRVGKRLREGVDFGGEQGAGAGDGREFGDAVSRRLGAMRAAKRVVDVHVAELGHFLREHRVVLLLAAIQAAVLEDDELARLDRDAVDPVRAQQHFAAEQFGDPLGHRRKRVFGLGLAFARPAEVRGDHDRGAGLQRQ